MKLEDMEIGSVVNVKFDSLTEKVVFFGVIGNRYSFIKEQNEGEYIVSFNIQKGLIRVEGDNLEFDRRDSKLTVYRPQDPAYGEARELLTKVNLFRGASKK